MLSIFHTLAASFILYACLPEVHGGYIWLAGLVIAGFIMGHVVTQALNDCSDD